MLLLFAWSYQFLFNQLLRFTPKQLWSLDFFSKRVVVDIALGAVDDGGEELPLHCSSDSWGRPQVTSGPTTSHRPWSTSYAWCVEDYHRRCCCCLWNCVSVRKNPKLTITTYDHKGRLEIAQTCSHNILQRCGQIDGITNTYLGHGGIRPCDLRARQLKQSTFISCCHSIWTNSGAGPHALSERHLICHQSYKGQVRFIWVSVVLFGKGLN
jgi:hypothetical protein